MLNKSWWELWPGRLEFELEALESAGIRSQRDEDAFKSGTLALRVEMTLSGRPLILLAIFPKLYPYFRPEVFAQPGTFERHQNPIGGNLCLLARRTENWDTDWTLAQLLTSQLPKLELAATTKNFAERAAIEEPLGEPVTTYFPYSPNSIILIDCSKPVGVDNSRGQLSLWVEDKSAPKLRAKVLQIKNQAGRKILSFEGRPWRGHEVAGTWVRLDKPPIIGDPRQFEKELITRRVIPAPKFNHKVGAWFLDVVGLLFPEELGQGVFGDGWMFLVRWKQDKTQMSKTEFVRAGRSGITDFAARIPELAFLSNKRAAVIGLGGIGAPIALELARSGLGEIWLVDFDFIEAGSIVRWPLGLSAVGFQKTETLKKFIERNYATRANIIEYRFGSRSFLETDRSTEDLLKALCEADIVIDATAESGIHHFLSDYASANTKPFIYAYATPGGYGGLVASIDPAKSTGCWGCLQWALYESKCIPEPRFLDNAEMQPPGCGERTATFTAFDTGEVALEATRLAISTLSDGSKGHYPKSGWDVAIVNLRSESGARIVPTWSEYQLPKLCPKCR